MATLEDHPRRGHDAVGALFASVFRRFLDTVERPFAAPPEDREDGLVATGFPSRRRHLNINIHFYYQMAMVTHGVRRAGAAALDLAYVACGRLDGFWEFGLNPWDMAAGKLLVAEAGGRSSGMRGDAHRMTSPDLLASNGAIHDQALALFDEIFRGEFRYKIPEINRES